MLFEVLTEEEARELSRQDGFESGYEDGLAEGRAEGKEEGQYRKALDTARKMKAKGFELVEIAELTDLPLDEIEGL